MDGAFGPLVHQIATKLFPENKVIFFGRVLRQPSIYLGGGAVHQLLEDDDEVDGDYAEEKRREEENIVL